MYIVLNIIATIYFNTKQYNILSINCIDNVFRPSFISLPFYSSSYFPFVCLLKRIKKNNMYLNVTPGLLTEQVSKSYIDFLDIRCKEVSQGIYNIGPILCVGE